MPLTADMKQAMYSMEVHLVPRVEKEARGKRREAIEKKIEAKKEIKETKGPEGTIKFDSPNACNICHTDKSPEWANNVVKQRKNGNYQGI